MRIQILLLLLLTTPLAIFGCSSAQTVIDKDLVSKSDRYEISERPKAFSGDRLIFGPYSATGIDRSFISSSGSGLGSLSGNSKGQNFTYNFKGDSHWSGKCVVRGESISLGSITGGMTMEFFCSFIPGKENRSPDAKGWYFMFKGPDLVSAEGSFKAGSRTVRVVATNKMEGSSLPYTKPTGYYFYVENKVIAGVDVINSKGPVWLDKGLNAKERDAIGLVIVALLLNQV